MNVCMERVKRIELSSSAWKAEVLPLNYTRDVEICRTNEVNYISLHFEIAIVSLKKVIKLVRNDVSLYKSGPNFFNRQFIFDLAGFIFDYSILSSKITHLFSILFIYRLFDKFHCFLCKKRAVP